MFVQNVMAIHQIVVDISIWTNVGDQPTDTSIRKAMLAGKAKRLTLCYNKNDHTFRYIF